MKKKTVVVFDFDGTFTKKDTFLMFVKFSVGNFHFFLAFLLFSPLILAMKLNLYPNWKVKESLFSFLYKGVPLSKFNDWGYKFSSEIEKIQRPKALEALKHHKNRGDKVVIISASIENWIKPWAKNTGFDMVLATKIEQAEDGLLTGKFISKNCYGKEKVNRLLEVFPDRHDYTLITYGDSRGDKELMEISDEGYYKKFN
jgi:phosphatidylglycerophosphatase C